MYMHQLVDVFLNNSDEWTAQKELAVIETANDLFDLWTEDPEEMFKGFFPDMQKLIKRRKLILALDPGIRDRSTGISNLKVYSFVTGAWRFNNLCLNEEHLEKVLEKLPQKKIYDIGLEFGRVQSERDPNARNRRTRYKIEVEGFTFSFWLYDGWAMAL